MRGIMAWAAGGRESRRDDNSSCAGKSAKRVFALDDPRIDLLCKKRLERDGIRLGAPANHFRLAPDAALHEGCLPGILCMGLFSRFFVAVRRVGKAKRAHHSTQIRLELSGGGHGAKGAFAHPTRMRSRHALEKGLFRRMHRVGGSDMHPHAVEPQAEQPLLLVGGIEHFRQ
jgi:hypothetical protein